MKVKQKAKRTEQRKQLGSYSPHIFTSGLWKQPWKNTVLVQNNFSVCLPDLITVDLFVLQRRRLLQIIWLWMRHTEGILKWVRRPTASTAQALKVPSCFVFFFSLVMYCAFIKNNNNNNKTKATGTKTIFVLKGWNKKMSTCLAVGADDGYHLISEKIYAVRRKKKKQAVYFRPNLFISQHKNKGVAPLAL